MNKSFLVVLLSSLSALAAAGPRAATVQPVAETDPVPSSGDAADDPAVWVSPGNPEKSLIFGTDKQSGVGVYDLSGKQIAFHKLGNLNNIDIRQNVSFGGPHLDILAATNRTNGTLEFYEIKGEGGSIQLLASVKLGIEPYGSCMGTLDGGGVFAINVAKTGAVDAYSLTQSSGTWKILKSGGWKMKSQGEGCVVDEAQGLLFVGEETSGVWKIDYKNPKATLTTVAQIGKSPLVADIEGMSIYSTGSGTGYLVVSNQGKNEYVLFDRKAPHALVGSFSIQNSPNGVDGTSGTDGLDVLSANLGPHFPNGLVVVQDGTNSLTKGGSSNQNFKIVDWRAVSSALNLK